MKFKTLDDKEIRINILPEKYPVRSRDQCKSYGQYLLGRVIRSIYGTSALVLEEFSIPGERLFIDFYMPHHGLAFEFHGKQHQEYNEFFHGDKKGFEKSLARDQRKRRWCEINSIILIEVNEIVSKSKLMGMIVDARNG
jgi:hypothetical protein